MPIKNGDYWVCGDGGALAAGPDNEVWASVEECEAFCESLSGCEWF